MRLIFFAGAVALAAATPMATLAHPASTPVYRPAAPPRSMGAGARESRGAHEEFRVPFDVQVAPKPLPESLRSGPALQAASPQTTFNPFKWRGSISNPAYLWYQPGWYAPACAANTLWNPFGNPSTVDAMQNGNAEFDTKIASLVDGKGLLATYGSEAAKNAAGMASSSTNAPSAGGVTLQVGLPATACGIPNFTNWPI